MEPYFVCSGYQYIGQLVVEFGAEEQFGSSNNPN